MQQSEHLYESNAKNQVVKQKLIPKKIRKEKELVRKKT